LGPRLLKTATTPLQFQQINTRTTRKVIFCSS
jgi:hypothetical protein